MAVRPHGSAKRERSAKHEFVESDRETSCAHQICRQGYPDRFVYPPLTVTLGSSIHSLTALTGLTALPICYSLEGVNVYEDAAETSILASGYQSEPPVKVQIFEGRSPARLSLCPFVLLYTYHPHRGTVAAVWRAVYPPLGFGIVEMHV